jgi:hypothetical protein
MVFKMAKKQSIGNVKENSLIIRPIGKRGGLDSIHLALIVLVVVLVLLIASMAYNKEIIIRNESAINCTYGSFNGTCIVPKSNASQVKTAFERIIASYADSSSSLSIIPYIINKSTLTVNYMPGADEWLAKASGYNPSTNQSFNFTVLINDSNNSDFIPFVGVIRPSNLSQNRLVSTGVIKLAGKYSCTQQSPVQVFWFLDPYSPGAIQSLSNEMAIKKEFNSSVNVTLKMLYTQSSVNIAKQYGITNAQALAGYMFCASQQPEFNKFVENLQSVYSNSYVSPGTLAAIANQTGLNNATLSSCLANYPQVFERQNLLSNYYNITASPMVVTNCEYETIPQTVKNAVCYTNSSIC